MINAFKNHIIFNMLQLLQNFQVFNEVEEKKTRSDGKR